MTPTLGSGARPSSFRFGLARPIPSLELGWGSRTTATLVAIGLGCLLGAAVSLGSPLYVVAALLGLGAGLLIVSSAQLGLLAFIALVALLPFAVVPVRLGFQVTFLEAVLLALLAHWAFATLRRDRSLEATSVAAPLVAYLGLAAAAFAVGTSYQLDTELARRFFKWSLAVAFFFTVANLVRSHAEIERLLRWLILGGTCAAVIGLGLYLQPPETAVRLLSSLRVLGYPSGGGVLRFLPGANDTYTETLRATGTAVDPNALGGFLLVCLAVAISQWTAPRPILPRWSLLLMAGTMLACLVFTYSRSAWVGLAAGLLYLGTFRYRQAWLVGLVAVAVVIYSPIGHPVLTRLEEGLAGRDPATILRFAEYRNAVEIILRYPFLGIGFGAAPGLDLHPGVSSLYLLIAEQTGLVSLGLWLGVVLSLLGRALASVLSLGGTGSGPLLVSLSTALVAGLVAGLFDHYFANPLFPHMVALFWLLLALLWRATVGASPES